MTLKLTANERRVLTLLLLMVDDGGIGLSRKDKAAADAVRRKLNALSVREQPMKLDRIKSVTLRKMDNGDGLLVAPDRVVQIAFYDGDHQSDSAVYPREEVIEWVRRWLTSCQKSG